MVSAWWVIHHEGVVGAGSATEKGAAAAKDKGPERDVVDTTAAGEDGPGKGVVGAAVAFTTKAKEHATKAVERMISGESSKNAGAKSD